MKYLLILLAILLTGCVDDTSKRVLTYRELLDYPVNCNFAKEQLEELHYTQKVKHFPEDPDLINNDLDRAFNSRLKATIWWFAYSCNQ